MADFTGRLTHAPVVYALCEVRFAPILKMDSYVPEIQDRLRASYEGFDQELITDVQVQSTGQTAVQNSTRWRFERADLRSGYILHNHSLVFHTTAYSDFDDFMAEVLRGLEVVTNVANVPRYVRVGLRYVDLIEDKGGHKAEAFLHPLLRGFASELVAIKEGISQYIFAGESNLGGRLLLRVTKGLLNVPLPPDLLPLVLTPHRMPNAKRPGFFLDTDHFVERADLIPKLDQFELFLRELKVPIRDAFKRAVTPEAIDQWK